MSWFETCPEDRELANELAHDEALLDEPVIIDGLDFKRSELLGHKFYTPMGLGVVIHVSSLEVECYMLDGTQEMFGFHDLTMRAL